MHYVATLCNGLQYSTIYCTCEIIEMLKTLQILILQAIILQGSNNIEILPKSNTYTNTHRFTDTDTDTQTHTHTYIDTDRQKDTDRQMHTHAQT